MSTPRDGTSGTSGEDPGSPRDTVAPMTCRGCRHRGLSADIVFDLGDQPSTEDFPAADDPGPDATYPVAMWLCPSCALAQLVHDSSDLPETPVVESAALASAARAAVARAADEGWFARATTFVSLESAHGGGWRSLLQEHRLTEASPDGPADVIADAFALMHEPDQHAALRSRSLRLARSGVMLLHVHLLGTIVSQGQWTSLRLGHFAYYSLTALARLMSHHGLELVDVHHDGLYGGSAVVIVRHRGQGPINPSVEQQLRAEADQGLGDVAGLRSLQGSVTRSVDAMVAYLDDRRRRGMRVAAYGAASRATVLLWLARAAEAGVTAVADASAAKHGRRLPGSALPIISPDELVASEPDEVMVMLPDLMAEVAVAMPQLAGRLRSVDDLGARP